MPQLGFWRKKLLAPVPPNDGDARERVGSHSVTLLLRSRVSGQPDSGDGGHRTARPVIGFSPASAGLFRALQDAGITLVRAALFRPILLSLFPPLSDVFLPRLERQEARVPAVA
jgi:hypothetical protein